MSTETLSGRAEPSRGARTDANGASGWRSGHEPACFQGIFPFPETEQTPVRQHYKKAPQHVQIDIEHTKDDPYSFVQKVFACGYDCTRDDIPHEHIEAHASLMADGKPTAESAQYGIAYAAELEREWLAIRFWNARRNWAQNTSIKDDRAEAARAQQEARERRRQAAVEERARQLMNEQEETQWANARVKAAKEIGGAHA